MKESFFVIMTFSSVAGALRQRTITMQRFLQGFLHSLPIQARYFIPYLVTGIVVLGIYLLPASFSDFLLFEREAIEQGKWWALFTGQWVHLDAQHVAMNLLGLMLAWLLFAEYSPRWSLLFLVIWIGLISNLGMFFFDESIQTYVGFSGVLYGLFAWGIAQDIRHRVPWASVFAVLLFAKLSYDLLVGPVALSGLDADSIAVSAHFYGACAGVIAALYSQRVSSYL